MRIGYFCLFFLLLAACVGNSSDPSRQSSEPPQTPSVSANAQPGKMLLARYMSLRDAFVEADTVSADAKALAMRVTADSLSKDTLLLTKETAPILADIVAELDGLVGEMGIEQRRRAFVMVGEKLQDFLRKSNYDGGTVYVQSCPMAFQDAEEASWLSDSREILNPYLGKHHPRYAAGMLHCGEIRDSLGSLR